ncbi:MAG TPA: permease-like cell division protein FtsX, partial [Candidatus Saccharimonadales bacterium]
AIMPKRSINTHNMIIFMTFGRILKNGVQNFLRNITLAIAAIAVMTITLTTILILVITNATLNNTINQINSKIDISVYLKDSVTVQQKDTLLTQLKGLSEVKSVKYISKDQALALYEAQNAGNKTIQSATTALGINPIPATINITPISPSQLTGIKQFLNQPSVIALQAANSSYSGALQTAINKIAKTTKLLREAGLIGIIVFGTTSVLIIFNTIRMTIFNRRDEIQTMRLLGASTWFIKGPYVVENVIYGLLSATISLAFVEIMFTTVSNSLQASSFGLLNIGYSQYYFKHYFFYILLVIVSLGIIIGAGSALVATRRYLQYRTRR